MFRRLGAALFLATMPSVSWAQSPAPGPPEDPASDEAAQVPASAPAIPPEVPPPPPPPVDLPVAPLLSPDGPVTGNGVVLRPPPGVFLPPAATLPPSEPIGVVEGTLFGGVPAIGLLLTLVGAGVYGAAPGDEICGLTGCVVRRSRLLENAGASLMAGGLGLTVSGFSLFAFAGGVPEGRTRRSTPLAALGYGLVAGSLASLGVGIAQGATYDSDFDDLSTAWPWWFASGLGAVAGIPLLAVGSSLEPLPEPQGRIGALEHHSIPMAVTGGVLVGVSGLAAIAGSAFGIASLTTSEFGGFGGFLLGSTLFGGSMVVAAVGIPLMVVGLRREAVGPATSKTLAVESALIPQLSVGPLGASATWGLP